VLALIAEKRDMTLLLEVETGVRLVRYAPGTIEFEPAPGADRALAGNLKTRLRGWTGQDWAVVLSSGGAPTIAEARAARKGDLVAQAEGHPLVQAALRTFPGAKLRPVLRPAVQALPEVPDDWEAVDE
jgi:DNA polymerase-3 subunit gamma/tau